MTSYVLVHGVAHGAWCWDRTVADLQARGHVARALDLPLTSHADDVAAVRSLLDGIDESVVLVGHSYGGHVISAAAADRDDVDHLVYVAAMMLDADESFVDISAAYPQPRLVTALEIGADGRFTIDPKAAVDCFYARCDPAEAEAAVARLRPTALACVSEPAGAAAWRNHRSTYVVCGRDRSIDPDFQRAMARHADAVVEFDTDHSPFMSWPAEFVGALAQIA